MILRATAMLMAASLLVPGAGPPLVGDATRATGRPPSRVVVDQIPVTARPPSGVVGVRWAWPVAAPHPIARAYAAPANPYAAGHRGVDIAAAAGSEVRAPADGVVHFAGYVVDRPLLSIEHAGAVLSSFEPVEPLVGAGDRVVRGQVIGVLLAGHCASACLHLGARVAGEYVNPLLFLGEVPRAVLLPMG